MSFKLKKWLFLGGAIAVVTFGIAYLLLSKKNKPTTSTTNVPSSTKQQKEKQVTYILNTGNPGKIKEFKRLFSQHGVQLKITKKDVREINADPIKVVTQKACQFPYYTIVEDTSLDVQGAKVGINIKWFLKKLPKLVGRKAIWRVLLAYRGKDNKVYIYQGEVKGKIVRARGKGFGFDPYFQPEGSRKTLAQDKPDRYNARAKAVMQLVQENPFSIEKPIMKWDGAWQKS